MSLLKKAPKKPSRLKMYIYGDTGTGKTVTALQMPSPAVIDTERGTEPYGGDYDFDVLYSSKMEDLMALIEELLEEPQGYRTIVVDNFLDIWNNMVIDLRTYLRKKKDNPRYEVTGLDYTPLKNQLKVLKSRILELDMNIVFTAPSKPIYDPTPGEFMKVIGSGPEGPKELPRMFDVVLEIIKDKNTGERFALVDKDRNNVLPQKFSFNYDKLVEYFGIENLIRESKSEKSLIKNDGGRNTLVKYNGKEIYTAGITREQMEKIEHLVSEDKKEDIVSMLKNDFGVNNFLDLRHDEAKIFIKAIEETEE